MRALTAFLALMLALIAPPASAQSTWDNVERVVVIADLEGDYARFTQSLQHAGLINAEGDWTGGRAHFVQLGDVPDRGAHSRRILDHLMRLEGQAERAGGRVHALIGNHEAMNVTGDLRYVHPGEYEAFADRQSARRRTAYLNRTIDFLRANPPPEGAPTFDAAWRTQWESEHPLGYVEHRIAWQAGGVYGRWIATHNAIIRINDTLYAHGGLGQAFLAFDLEQINEAVRAALRGQGPTTGPFANILENPEGPLWHRAFAIGEEAAESANLAAVLARYGAQRMIVGHTKRAALVLPRFGGRFLIADIAEPEGYRDPHAYVLIEGAATYAVHRGQRVAIHAGTPEELCAYFTAIVAADPPGSPNARLREAACAPPAPATSP